MELLEWMESNNEQNKKKLTQTKYFNLCFVGGIALLSLIIGVVYVLLSKTVYFWDSATYWDIGRMLAKKPLGFEFFKEVYDSIGAVDYNYFVAVPVVLWMKLFGVTRVSYVAGIFVLYLVPTEIVMYFTAKRVSKAPRFAFVITLLLIPSFIYLAAIGFIDIAGVLVGLLCYYLYFTDVLKNKPYIKSVILGILLVIVMVIRRYFAFFSVSFITAMVIDSILFKRDIKRLAITIVTSGVVLAVFFNAFLLNILLKDYGTLYSSYKYSVFTDLKLITRYFGLLFLLLVFASVPFCVAKRRELRGVFALLQTLVCAAMFMATQTHGQQHLLLYVPALLMLIMLGINCVDKKRTLTGVCILALLNTLSPCINRVQPNNIQEIKSLAILPSYSVKPQKRTDINAVLALKKTLDKKIPDGKKCGVLASSFALNSSVLMNVVPSLNMKEEREDDYIVGLPEVDSRDYWRLNEIYSCDYILVAEPAQTHLAPDEQTIITEAVSSFSQNTDIAQAFSEITEFKPKIGNAGVKLYKRISEVTETAKTEFELRLYK